jgi:hypothetical protein
MAILNRLGQKVEVSVNVHPRAKHKGRIVEHHGHPL